MPWSLGLHVCRSPARVTLFLMKAAASVPGERCDGVACRRSYQRGARTHVEQVEVRVHKLEQEGLANEVVLVNSVGRVVLCTWVCQRQ